MNNDHEAATVRQALVAIGSILACGAILALYGFLHLVGIAP